eukprot:5906360-Prymnesium_polylepis.1
MSDWRASVAVSQRNAASVVVLVAAIASLLLVRTGSSAQESQWVRCSGSRVEHWRGHWVQASQ